ncbi:MAG TPA: DUF3089 domain-containing protein [Saprospiraceae bacterium]|nr:DUF3089 domain-containing protein [Saprospiraceae bacterium]
MKNPIACLVLLVSLLYSCATTRPQGPFNSPQVQKAPDYSDPFFWAALPDKEDPADRVPEGLASAKKEQKADVFFLYPTIYTGQKGDTEWNAPVDDEDFNQRVDESTILFQASAFNAAGRIFAPRYRQAHLSAYYTDNTAAAKKAFELAYQDLKNAFQYYLENHNGGRPIIIAAHSQGTTHGRRLISEFFDGKPLQKQLVAAYLVGIAVPRDEFEYIEVCQSPEATGCFVSWRTYKAGYIPDSYTSEKIAVVNPLTWTTDAEVAEISLNEGGLLRNFDKVRPGLTNAQINAEQGILWARKPKFFGNFLLMMKNYHVADINFYYTNVRENAERRVEAFLSK